MALLPPPIKEVGFRAYMFMKLSELNEVIKRHLDRNGDAEVMITLSEPSIGCRAFSNVKHACMGFDWESGQFRLEPEKKLTSFSKDRDNPQAALRITFNTRGYRPAIECPKCETKLRKDDRYCPHCGQAIKIGEYREITR